MPLMHGVTQWPSGWIDGLAIKKIPATAQSDATLDKLFRHVPLSSSNMIVGIVAYSRV